MSSIIYEGIGEVSILLFFFYKEYLYFIRLKNKAQNATSFVDAFNKKQQQQKKCLLFSNFYS